jgi:hypothetical protein
MRKIFLSLTLLLLFATPGFCQRIKPVKIDSVVTVSLPSGYKTTDTLNERIFSVNSMYGYMIAIRQANIKNNTPLKKEKDLNKVFKDMVKDIQSESAGSSAQFVRDTTIGRLKAKTFRLKSDDGLGNDQFRNFVLLYTQDATYTFEYVYPGNRIDLVKDEYKAFIASIKLSPELQRNDQYLSSAGGMSTLHKIEIFGGAGLIIILAVVFIARKKEPEPKVGRQRTKVKGHKGKILSPKS